MVAPSDYPQKDFHKNIPKPDSCDCEEPEEIESLSHILQVHGLFGITYCGNTPLGKRQNIKRILAVIYDLLLIVFYITTHLILFTEDQFQKIFQNTNNKGVMNFIFKIVGLSTIIEYLTIKFMLLINGTNLLKTVNSIGFVKSRKQINIIWITLIITIVINSMATILNFIDLDKILAGFNYKAKIDVFIIVVNGLIHSVVRVSILSILLYSSFVISQQLDGWATNFETNSIGNPKKLSQKVIELSRKIERINKVSGPIMLAKIAADSIATSGGICALAIGHVKIMPKIGIIIFVMSSLLDISIGCRSSQFITNSMDNLCKAIENSISTKTYSNDDYQQLKLILSLKGNFRYGVLNLFDLKDITIFLAISYITNYAVILIQTQ